MKIVYVVAALSVAFLLIGTIRDYTISLQNLAEVLLFSWLLYPIVKMRILDVIRYGVAQIRRNEEVENG